MRRNSKEIMVRTDVTILPQGKRGVLPNMDLVFLVGKLLIKVCLAKPAAPSRFHRFGTAITTSIQIGTRFFGWKACQWQSLTFTHPTSKSSKLGQGYGGSWTAYPYSLARGPWQAHAPALDRGGIDSLMIQVKFHGTYYRDPVVEFIQYLEYLIHALSDLQERLHHSVTLYLMPNPKMFVSHV
jgi:hypothetical protein